MSLKILATSDLHGNLPYIRESFDLLLIAGDVCPVHDQYYAYQGNWMNGEFAKWINHLPYKDASSKVVMTWGNHDFIGESWTTSDVAHFEKITNHRVKVLCHDLYDYNYVTSGGDGVLTIFATPYCSIFGNWAFMVSDETLEKKFSQIPEGVDILMSHDSPTINRLGAITEGPAKWRSDTTGNKVLDKHIGRIEPKLFISGHFHSGNHIPEVINGTLMSNVSYVNEEYKPVNDILEIDFDEEKKKFKCAEKKD